MNSRKPDLNEVKEKVVSTAGLLFEKTMLLKDAAEEKARIVTQKAKLRAESARNSSRIDRLYSDLGSLYYCMMKDSPDEQMKQLCEEITVLLDRNEELDRQLKELKLIENPFDEMPADGDPAEPGEPAEEAPEAEPADAAEKDTDIP